MQHVQIGVISEVDAVLPLAAMESAFVTLASQAMIVLSDSVPWPSTLSPLIKDLTVALSV